MGRMESKQEVTELVQRVVTTESSHLPSGWRNKREEGLVDRRSEKGCRGASPQGH